MEQIQKIQLEEQHDGEEILSKAQNKRLDVEAIDTITVS